jgi:hypothetical protein
MKYFSSQAEAALWRDVQILKTLSKEDLEFCYLNFQCEIDDEQLRLMVESRLFPPNVRKNRKNEVWNFRGVFVKRRFYKGGTYRGKGWKEIYEPRLYLDGEKHRLGTFMDPVLAAYCYDKYAVKHLGAAAVINFPYSSKEYVELHREEVRELAERHSFLLKLLKAEKGKK